MNTTGIILAAGKGTRMRSELPKVLHHFRGEPFVRRIAQTARKAVESVVVVVGYRGDEVIEVLPNGVLVARQEMQLGTGDAVRSALNAVPDDSEVVVVIPGDLPQIDSETITKLLQIHLAQISPLTFATAVTPDFEDWRNSFYRFGRIVRDEHGRVRRIVEYKDATDTERDIHEVNVGIYVFDLVWLRIHIPQLRSENAAGEIYLTDLIALAVSQGAGVSAVPIPDIRQGAGVNSPEELHLLEHLHAE